MKIPIEGTCGECPCWARFENQVSGPPAGTCRIDRPRFFMDRTTFPVMETTDWCYPGRLLIQEMKEDESKPPHYSVTITNYGDKIRAIKAVRNLTGKGLKEAKELIESAPVMLASNLSWEIAQEINAVLQAAGMETEITSTVVSEALKHLRELPARYSRPKEVPIVETPEHSGETG